MAEASVLDCPNIPRLPYCLKVHVLAPNALRQLTRYRRRRSTPAVEGGKGTNGRQRPATVTPTGFWSRTRSRSLAPFLGPGRLACDSSLTPNLSDSKIIPSVSNHG
jgi:hypothetical protein